MKIRDIRFLGNVLPGTTDGCTLPCFDTAQSSPFFNNKFYLFIQFPFSALFMQTCTGQNM